MGRIRVWRDFRALDFSWEEKLAEIRTFVERVWSFRGKYFGGKSL